MKMAGSSLFQNELVKIGLTHRKLGWEVSMIPVSMTFLYHIVKVRCGCDTRDCHCRFHDKFKILRTLPSEHGIELGFFHDYRIT